MRRRRSTSLTEPLAVLLALLWSPRGSCSPCCGGASETHALISGDQAAQLTAAAAQAVIIGDASSDPDELPVFRRPDRRTSARMLRIEGAVLLDDFWQMGASFSVLSPEAGHAFGSPRLGDTGLTLGYEFLPEWTYSKWKPRGFAFAGIVLPTGKNSYESDSIPGATLAADGSGFYSLVCGVLLVKRWSSWDSRFQLKAQASLPREFEQAATRELLDVTPGPAVDGTWGIGLSPGGGALRVGASIQPRFAFADTISARDGISRTSYHLVWNSSLEASYLLGAGVAIFATYRDQTLLGPAINTALTRSLALGASMNWER